MNFRLFVLPQGLWPLALAATLPAHGQSSAPQPLPPTVVTATRVPQPLTDVVADVSVVDRETIERSGAASLGEVLSRLPGVELVRNGGPAGNTSLFLRGAESRFTAVYLDGVRIDSQAGDGGASWNALPLAQVDRIEVVRGPAAAVYGSDAIAGVVQIFTRKGEGAFNPSVTAAVGTHHRRALDLSATGTKGRLDYAIGLARESSDGFDARPTFNPDRDGYRSLSGSARLGVKLAEGQRLEATWLDHDLDADYDGSRTQDDRSASDLRSLGLHWTAVWSKHYTTRVSVSESQDRYATSPSPYQTKTRVRSHLWQNEIRLGAQLFTVAAERREDRLESSAVEGQTLSRAQNALALGYGLRQGAHTLQLNARHDDDSEFGGKTTGSIAYALALAQGWRGTLSYGSAFRAPSLYQRFSEYGAPTLQPQSSHNVEAGLRYAQGSSAFSVAVYRNRVRDLIDFVFGPGPCPGAGEPFSLGCYANVGKAEYAGLSLQGNHRLGRVDLSASVDFQRPRDRATDNLLARRAPRHATLGARTLWADWTVGADWRLSSYRYDRVDNLTRLGGYGLVDLSASRTVAKDWTLIARVDNLGDKDYEMAKDYATAGRTVYLALKWSPR
ncbi:TonB-dependent receptor domain-containing protein [Caldimonas brevitalea]|uniref:TonB-dependent receptor n=1 Tax=Caldimonas brevitalea TaxID=413882 RepID=A0A0G3BP15_9BURK|nr:TonB-dependent receptor [Caldimonas brevitalea]AKJ29106.1 TonB-dependent receptor [Caldimonas brevitalea]